MVKTVNLIGFLMIVCCGLGLVSGLVQLSSTLNRVYFKKSVCFCSYMINWEASPDLYEIR